MSYQPADLQTDKTPWVHTGLLLTACTAVCCPLLLSSRWGSLVLAAVPTPRFVQAQQGVAVQQPLYDTRNKPPHHCCHCCHCCRSCRRCCHTRRAAPPPSPAAAGPAGALPLNDPLTRCLLFVPLFTVLIMRLHRNTLAGAPGLTGVLGQPLFTYLVSSVRRLSLVVDVSEREGNGASISTCGFSTRRVLLQRLVLIWSGFYFV